MNDSCEPILNLIFDEEKTKRIIKVGLFELNSFIGFSSEVCENSNFNRNE